MPAKPVQWIGRTGMQTEGAVVAAVADTIRIKSFSEHEPTTTMRNRITRGGQTYALPGNLRQRQSIGECTVCILDQLDTAKPDADVELPSYSQNLVCFDGQGLRWIVDSPPDTAEDTETFSKVYDLGGRLISLTDDGNYEVSLEDGSIDGHWPSDELEIGGRRIQFDHQVEDVAVVDGITIVRAGSGSGTNAASLSGYDEAGTELWKRRHRAWQFHGGEKLLRMGSVRATRAGHVRVDLDPETGAIVDARAPTEYVQSEIDFEAIDDPFAHVWQSRECVLFDADGAIRWQRQYPDAETLQAIRHEDLTVVASEETTDGELAGTLVEGIEDDGTVRWTFHTNVAVTIESGEDYPLLLYEDDSETLAFELDHVTGKLRGQVEGPETDTARAILNEHR